MSETNFTTFKYDHGDRISFSKYQKITCAVLAGLALCIFAFSVKAGVAALVVLLIFILASSPAKVICVSPRFLICGTTILYYRNIRKMSLNRQKGEFSLMWGDKKSLRIQRDCFPTKARKKEKIAINKAAKFTKVSDKIIIKVLKAVPEVQLAGIERNHTSAVPPPKGKSK